MRRLSALVAVLAVFALAGAGVAIAEPPFRLADRVTDRARVLAPDQTARIDQAIDRLRTEDGVDLFVVYVASFDGESGQQWADRAAELSQLGDRDVLLAVAVEDRAYGISAPEDVRLGDSEVEDVESRLAANDWAGAAITLADRLRTGGSGSAIALVATVVGGVVVIGGGAYLLTRRRRARPAPTQKAAQEAAPRDEFTDVSTEDLAYRASAALIEVDDAVRTSEQELTAARAHFGEEAVSGFVAALEQARADMLRAFEIRQRLDDEQPETEPEQRALHAEIIRLATAADDRLDAQVEAFDALRALEARAPEYIADLAVRHGTISARVPQVEAAWTELRARYAATALEPVADDLDHARRLLAAASTEIVEAQAALAGRTPDSGATPAAATGSAAAVVDGRAAEDALTQAEQLLDGIGRREDELTDAAARIPAARAEVEQDLAEARALGSLASVVARGEAALAAAEQAATGPQPDPLAALRLLNDAGTALDQGIADARAEQDRARRASAALDQALLTARSSITAASDFITTRRGAVGAPARTRLAEAQRHLQQAGGPDPFAALREAQQADVLAQEALRLAQADVAQWPSGWGSPGAGSPGRGSDLGADLAAMVLGGILAGASRGSRGGHRGGGGWSTGSFGGSARRGRRSFGGRF